MGLLEAESWRRLDLEQAALALHILAEAVPLGMQGRTKVLVVARLLGDTGDAWSMARVAEGSATTGTTLRCAPYKQVYSYIENI